MEYMDVYDEKALGYKVQILDWHGTLDVRKIEAVGPYKCGKMKQVYFAIISY